MDLSAINNIRKTDRNGKAAVYALRKVRFPLSKGGHMAIVREFDSGKSTRLNMIGALDMANGSKIIALPKETPGIYEQPIITITHNPSIAQTTGRVLKVSGGILTDWGRRAK